MTWNFTQVFIAKEGYSSQFKRKEPKSFFLLLQPKNVVQFGPSKLIKKETFLFWFFFVDLRVCSSAANLILETFKSPSFEVTQTPREDSPARIFASALRKAL